MQFDVSARQGECVSSWAGVGPELPEKAQVVMDDIRTVIGQEARRSNAVQEQGLRESPRLYHEVGRSDDTDPGKEWPHHACRGTLGVAERSQVRRMSEATLSTWGSRGKRFHDRLPLWLLGAGDGRATVSVTCMQQRAPQRRLSSWSAW